MTSHVPSLSERRPQLSTERLLADLVPPPHFERVSFDSYRSDPAQPSQAEAVDRLTSFAAATCTARASKGGLWGRLRRGNGSSPSDRPGVYLDGGFGVGKTHLLASLWHQVPGPKSFGTFVEYTNLAGALGFRQMVEALSGNRLVCIDEFELDDPGDTVLMARLLRELVDSGVRLAATSNTLPDALGEGRFAADDFVREIQAVSGHFDVMRVDGEDYRHRGQPQPPPPSTDEDVERRASQEDGAVLDDFERLTAHLAYVHPSRYGAMLDGVSSVHWRGVRTVDDQNVALRLVVLVDRMYDRELPLVASGMPLDAVFTEEMLRGGYRKKYRRALSRLAAMART